MVTTRCEMTLSEAARERFACEEGEPFLLNDWMGAAFLHFEVDAARLAGSVPFALDLYRGRAVVSAVAFTMKRLRLRSGGRWLAWLTAPVAHHGFLNIRTHVKHDGEAGIYFLAEYLPNRLSVLGGPRMYGLPFELGTLDYQHDHECGEVTGRVTSARGGCLQYEGTLSKDAVWAPCEAESLDAFLLERYTAFTYRQGTMRRFRIWHEPWMVKPMQVTLTKHTLLSQAGDWARDARLIGAHFSMGVMDVWMSKPRCVNGSGCGTTWLAKGGDDER